MRNAKCKVQTTIGLIMHFALGRLYALIVSLKSPKINDTPLLFLRSIGPNSRAISPGGGGTIEAGEGTFDPPGFTVEAVKMYKALLSARSCDVAFLTRS